MKKCLCCSKKYKNSLKNCPICNSKESIIVQRKNILINNQKISKKEWYYNSTSFVGLNRQSSCFKNLGIELNNFQKKEIFLNNVKKHTFLALILPSNLFLLISLISFSPRLFFQNSENFRLFQNKASLEGYLTFLGFIFLFLGLYLLYLTFIKKSVKIYTKTKGQFGYRLLNRQEMNNFLTILDENIRKDNLEAPNITTSKVKIKKLDYSDLKDLYEVFKNKEVCKYLLLEQFKNKDDAINFLYKTIDEYQKNMNFKLGIVDIKTNKVIGYIGLSKLDLTEDACQVVYAISKKYWHKGYTSSTLKAYLEYLRAQNKKIIYAGHVKENYNSGKVLLKCGFVRYEKKDCKMIIHNEEKEIISYIYRN